ncbi:MAG: hypothetical protein JO122_13680, partial [Acetobacteraceae bacterium]|nr:hypothetical protein [Acetobacteraceae bacterium]
KEVTLQRMYLDTMQDVLTQSQTLVVDDQLKGLLPMLQLNNEGPPQSAGTGQAAEKGSP